MSIKNIRIAFRREEALRARISQLEDALRPFATMSLSTEGEVSDLVMRTPAEELRRSAEQVEKRDSAILRARQVLGEDQ